MKIEELHSYSSSQFADLRRLQEELTSRVVLTETLLRAVVDDANSHMYVLVDGERIVGCATRCVFHSPTGRKASVEDVVVLSAYRGQGLGRMLVEHVIGEARRLAPIELQLTSKPSRVAANGLYQSLGFERKETNCYRMTVGE